jgi:hypothetical protein
LRQRACQRGAKALTPSRHVVRNRQAFAHAIVRKRVKALPVVGFFI